jgi:integrase
MARRNANGEGSIYKRKDSNGRWEATITLPTVDGKRRRVSFYGRTRKEAHEGLIRAKAQTQQGILLPDRNWKLGEYLDYWLENTVNAKRRPNTYKRYEVVVRLYLKPILGSKNIQKLSVHMLDDFYKQVLADGSSRNTVYQARKVLSAALTSAMRQELLIRNVAQVAEMPQYKPKEAQYWSTEEALKFLAVIESHSLRAAFVLVVLYGLREGEVLGIRWRDVDFAGDVLHIRQQVQRIDRKLQQVDLKTESSNRDEPLMATAREALMSHRNRQAAFRLAAGANWKGGGGEDELVFTTRPGNPIDPRGLYRTFQRICAAHGLRAITLHGLRHTNTTTQKDLEIPERDTQAILGHSSLSTTRIYQHVSLSNKQKALEKVEQHLFDQQFAEDRLGSRQSLPSNKKNST